MLNNLHPRKEIHQDGHEREEGADDCKEQASNHELTQGQHCQCFILRLELGERAFLLPEDFDQQYPAHRKGLFHL